MSRWQPVLRVVLASATLAAAVDGAARAAGVGLTWWGVLAAAAATCAGLRLWLVGAPGQSAPRRSPPGDEPETPWSGLRTARRRVEHGLGTPDGWVRALRPWLRQLAGTEAAPGGALAALIVADDPPGADALADALTELERRDDAGTA